LSEHLNVLAIEIGERNLNNTGSLRKTADYIAWQFSRNNLFKELDEFTYQATSFANVKGQITGTVNPEKIIVIGAHYDSVVGSPGANDNGTGVAALLALAQIFKNIKSEKTIRFVAFVNEESPYFGGPGMGSHNYARRCRDQNESIEAMFSLETMGYYSDETGSQTYPPGISGYPDQGNFIAFVANLKSAGLLTETTDIFKTVGNFPYQKIAAPDSLPGVSLSDHMCFWQMGYQAVMVTDTAPFRYPFYHTADDLPDKINMAMFTELVANLAKTFALLAGSNL